MPDYKVSEYVAEKGNSPFRDWILRLDPGVQGRIAARLDRFAAGHFGQNRHLGKGLCEAKLDFGPGYRLYYGIHGRRFVLLLCGGDKGGQNRDIKKAKNYWEDFLEGNHER